jgi:S-adenosyl-L-methionine hydrolase (adenosine-forming)
VDPADLGPEASEIALLPPFRAKEESDGSLSGRVLHIDRFGNIITSVRRHQLPGGRVTVRIAGLEVPGLARTYAEAEQLTALIGSAGYLEVSLPDGSAATALNVGTGEPVTVETAG